jgi:hypothetical protein
MQSPINYKPTNQFFAAIRNIKGGGLLVSKDALITITLNKDGFLEKNNY